MVETRSDLDHLLVDLESNDSNSLAAVLRTIYDCDESEKFMKKLETRISDHDLEIERMCSAHYKSFIDCIQELLQVRPNADVLKRETMDINTELVKSTDILQRKVEELIRARRILVNSSSSIELLKKCLFVLEQYSRFNDQLLEKKYFPALKILESIERDHLPTVGSYRFAQNMYKEIPKFRLIIKEAATKDLNDFLEGLLIKSQKIGEIVLSSAEEQQNFKMRREGAKNGTGELSALSLVDFCPVYRGLHIFTNLGFREEFNQYYREQRQKQSRLVFSRPMNMMSQSKTGYHDYFSSVIGFFVIENHLMVTTKGFIQPEYLNELWQNAIQTMTVSMKQNIKQCQGTSLILEIKELMMLFAFTIRNYGHNTDALADIMVTIREQYNEVLMQQWRHKFEEIFRQETIQHPLEDEVRNFIQDSLKFSQDLNSNEVEIMVKKSTNKLLIDLVNNPNIKLFQLIQITTNLNYLEDANMFKDARAESESQISKKLNEQIDEFLGLADYDWTLAEPTGQASGYISDLIAWLRSTFQGFVNLPQRVSQAACMSACKHISSALRDLLLSDDVKALSLGGLQQFNLDLIQCEVFASSEPVKGFKEGDLLMAFAELRQVCDLFLYEDYSAYMSDMGKQQNKYLRVTTATALTVIEKLREYDRKKGPVFASVLKRNDKQKLRDMFAKNLRQVQ